MVRCTTPSDTRSCSATASPTRCYRPGPGRRGRGDAAAHSALWRDLDASLLHALLLERLWQVAGRQPTGALPARCRRGPPRRPARRRHRCPDAAGEGRRGEGRRRERWSDAAQVDVVRTEAAHRARPAAARPIDAPRRVGRPRHGRRSRRSRGASTSLRLAGPPVPRQNRRRSAPLTSTTSPALQARATVARPCRHAAQSKVSTVRLAPTGGAEGRGSGAHDHPEHHQDVTAGQLSPDRLGSEPAHQMDLVGMLSDVPVRSVSVAEPATAASPLVSRTPSRRRRLVPEILLRADRQRQPSSASWGRPRGVPGLWTTVWR